MITHELLMMAIEARWPQLVHGTHFLVGHPVDSKTGEQCADAYVLRWEAQDIEQPDATALLEEAEQQRPVLAARQARSTRNTLLSGSDWTQLSDVRTDADAWKAYRQALRDVPQQAGFPMNIEWPEWPGNGS
jgi:hypothetical protein